MVFFFPASLFFSSRTDWLFFLFLCDKYDKMTFEMMINDFSMFLFYFNIVCQRFSLKFGLEV
jgi:hypothetical protein